MTAKAAFELSSGPADAPAHAALRMGLALRADDNDPMAMLVGAAMPKEAAESFARRGLTAPVPANLAPGERRAVQKASDSSAFDDLGANELIALLPSLEPAALAELAVHEREHAARPAVMRAIASLQGFEADR